MASMAMLNNQRVTYDKKREHDLLLIIYKYQEYDSCQYNRSCRNNWGNTIGLQQVLN